MNQLLISIKQIRRYYLRRRLKHLEKISKGARGMYAAEIANEIDWIKMKLKQP